MKLEEQIFSIGSNNNFDEICIDVFRYQYDNCDIYRKYLNLLGINADSVTTVAKIPFLPIKYFKSEKIYSSDKLHDIEFTSSSTTGKGLSTHYVANVGMYEQSFRLGFEHFYGTASDYTILALLPSYLERNGSSLIYMVEDLTQQSTKPDSGFFLHNHNELHSLLTRLQEQKKPTILIGVSFALLDFVEKYQTCFPELIVMETGGMKGRRKELVREELHKILYDGFGVKYIHSEYGMTECLSQAYSAGNGLYRCPPWMKIKTRDTYSPLLPAELGATGGINIIDLANLYSCSFIETQDLGRLYADGSFEILGRFDSSDIRGCSLMV